MLCTTGGLRDLTFARSELRDLHFRCEPERVAGPELVSVTFVLPVSGTLITGGDEHGCEPAFPLGCTSSVLLPRGEPVEVAVRSTDSRAITLHGVHVPTESGHQVFVNAAATPLVPVSLDVRGGDAPVCSVGIVRGREQVLDVALAPGVCGALPASLLAPGDAATVDVCRGAARTECVRAAYDRTAPTTLPIEFPASPDVTARVEGAWLVIRGTQGALRVTLDRTILEITAAAAAAMPDGVRIPIPSGIALDQASIEIRSEQRAGTASSLDPLTDGTRIQVTIVHPRVLNPVGD